MFAKIEINSMATKLKSIAFSFFPLLVFFSCDKISDLNLTLIRVPLTRSFEIKIDSAGPLADSASFSITKEFDPATENDYATNKSKLVEVQVDRIEYHIKSIASGTGDSLIEASFEFLNPSTGQYELLASDRNRKLSQDLVAELQLDKNAAARLASLFQGASPATQIRCRGRMNKLPLNFIIAPTIHLSLKSKI